MQFQNKPFIGNKSKQVIHIQCVRAPGS